MIDKAWNLLTSAAAPSNGSAQKHSSRAFKHQIYLFAITLLIFSAPGDFNLHSTMVKADQPVHCKLRNLFHKKLVRMTFKPSKSLNMSFEALICLCFGRINYFLKFLVFSINPLK